MSGKRDFHSNRDTNEEFNHVGPKMRGSDVGSSTSGAASMAYTAVYVSLFLLFVYSIVAGTIGIIAFRDLNQFYCPTPCKDGGIGPQGDPGTCVGQCFNGTNGTAGTNGTDGLNITVFPSFGQWNFNAILGDSPDLPFWLVSGPPGFWTLIQDPSSSNNGFFNTNNSTMFSSSPGGFDVIYNGPDNEWLTVSWSLVIQRHLPYSGDTTFYEVYYEDPSIPFVPGNVRINTIISTNGQNELWEVSTNAKMRLPTGGRVRASMFTFGTNINTTIQLFNLFVQQ